MSTPDFVKGLAQLHKDQAKVTAATQPASSNAGPLERWRASIATPVVQHGPAAPAPFHTHAKISAVDAWRAAIATTKV